MEQEALNLYGDKLVSTSGAHGADIASQRVDDLDRECLGFAALTAANGLAAIDFGCGNGAFGSRLAALGYKTFFYDLIPEPLYFSSLRSIPVVEEVRFDSGDLRLLDVDKLPINAHIVYSQRTIHYFTYGDALVLLKKIRSVMCDSSRMFLSASGLNSELGNNYLNTDVDIDNRFFHLSLDMQNKHEIREPVCLYTEDELVILAKEAGFDVQKIWSSAFGNVKGIFRPR